MSQPKQIEEEIDKIFNHNTERCADCKLLGKSECKVEKAKLLLLHQKNQIREEIAGLGIKEKPLEDKFECCGYHDAIKHVLELSSLSTKQ